MSSNEAKTTKGSTVRLKPTDVLHVPGLLGKPDMNRAGKLFDRFFFVEAARNSTGLGLAISKALVEQLGGTIAARYTGGKLSVCIAC